VARRSRRLRPAEKAAARARGPTARILASQAFADLRAELAEVDSVEVLARAAFSLQLRGPPPSSKESVLEVFHVELLQAISLARPRPLYAHNIDYPAVTDRVLRLVKRHAFAYLGQDQHGLPLNSAEGAPQFQIHRVRSWSFTVRGPRHTHQTRDFLNEQARAVDEAFTDVFGCTLSAALTLFDAVYDLLNARLKAELDWRRTWLRDRCSRHRRIELFLAGFPEDAADRLRAAVDRPHLDGKELRWRLFNEAEARLAILFTLSPEELEGTSCQVELGVMRNLLTRLSLRFGDVGADRLDHLQLANPVRLRPLVQMANGHFFCPSPQTLFTGLVEIVEDLCTTSRALKIRWEKARAAWLEAKLKAVVKGGLPDAEVYAKARWTDPDGTQGESDLVAVMDKTVMVFEAKSGKIPPPARRGAPDTLRKALDRLIVEPSAQSLRTKRRIEAACLPITFETADGPLTLDPEVIRAVVRVNIVFDSIGSLSSHWPDLMAAGLIPDGADIAPTMSVFELETVFEVLTLQIERCHYLNRRAELELNLRYVADELDLLALYHRCGFNLGEGEFAGVGLVIWGWSEHFCDGYSDRRAAGTLSFPISRPRLVRDALMLLESHQPAGWTRMGHRLLCLDPEEQKALERQVRQLRSENRRAPNTAIWRAGIFGPEARRTVIVTVVGPPSSSPAFEAIVREAAETGFKDTGAADLLMVYEFTPATGNAYDFIGVMRATGAD
jgi:hypothetical protein